MSPGLVEAAPCGVFLPGVLPRPDQSHRCRSVSVSAWVSVQSVLVGGTRCDRSRLPPHALPDDFRRGRDNVLFPPYLFLTLCVGTGAEHQAAGWVGGDGGVDRFGAGCVGLGWSGWHLAGCSCRVLVALGPGVISVDRCRCRFSRSGRPARRSVSAAATPARRRTTSAGDLTASPLPPHFFPSAVRRAPEPSARRLAGMTARDAARDRGDGGGVDRFGAGRVGLVWLGRHPVGR